jgi:hypothetical protein
MASLPPSGSYKKLQFIHFADRCLSPARSKNERSSVASYVMRNIKRKERIERTIRMHAIFVRHGRLPLQDMEQLPPYQARNSILHKRRYAMLLYPGNGVLLHRVEQSNGSPQPCIVLAPSQETLYFKLKAVEELRKTVAARAARSSLIWSVVMLLASECSLGNVQEQRVHLKGLSQLLDSNQDQAYPPKPKNCFRALNKRFESPLKRNLLPVEMLDTFRDVRLVSLMCHHRILNSASQSTHIVWLNYQILTIRHRLLSLSFDISDLRQAVLKCIQITTLLFIHTIDIDKIPAEALQSLIPQLEDTLCRTDLVDF